MMYAKYFIPAALALLITSAAYAKAGDRYKVRMPDNLSYRSNELFRAFENYHHPRTANLRERYGLEKIIQAEADEFRRIMLLRHWIHSTMPIDDPNAARTAPDVFAILETAMQGGKFNCFHFAVVQHAVLNSFGYITRTLGVGPGRNASGIDGHHAANEVWVNPLGKWVLVDAKYDLHFEKNGVPLSALEIRDEVWSNEARDVTAAFGLERKPAVPQINDRDWGIWATPQNYRWVSWDLNTNSFTTYPANTPSSALVMYEDRIYKEHIWFRDGKPHWAYGTPFLVKTARRDWIYWTPNTIASRVAVAGDRALITLDSFTPNFRNYQVRVDGQAWRDCEPSFEFEIENKDHQLVFRSVNLFGVAGPEHRIEIVRKKGSF